MREKWEVRTHCGRGWSVWIEDDNGDILRGVDFDAAIKIKEQICHEHNNFDALLEACEDLIEIHADQGKRESGEFLISSEVFMAMWDERIGQAIEAINNAKHP